VGDNWVEMHWVDPAIATDLVSVLIHGGEGNDSYSVSAATTVVDDVDGRNAVYIDPSINAYSFEVIDDAMSIIGISVDDGISLLTSNIGSTPYLFANGVAIRPTDLVATLNVTGTAGDEIIDLRGLDAGDIDLDSACISGLGGNDLIYGSSTDDEIDGGDGNDAIDGGDGQDELTGGKGNDVLRGGGGVDSLAGGRGDDTLYGGDSNDSLSADEGYDWLFGESGDDQLFLEDVDDRFNDPLGTNTVHPPSGSTSNCTGSGGMNLSTGGSGGQWSPSLVTSAQISCSTAIAAPEEQMAIIVVDAYVESDCECDIVPPEPRFILTEADEDWLAAQRAQWLPGLSNPQVPTMTYSYATFLQYVDFAEVALGQVDARQLELKVIINDSNATKQDFLEKMRDSLYALDVYLYEYQEVLQVEAQFASVQWTFSSADQALVARANNLPATIDGLEGRSTAEQSAAILANVAQFGHIMNGQLDSYDFAYGALKGVATGLAGAAVGVAVVAFAPVSVSLALGSILLAGGVGVTAGNRIIQGDDPGEVFVGTFADMTGVTSLSISLIGRDMVTGEDVYLEPEESGFAFGSGVTQLAMTLVTPGANGGTVQAKLPMPSLQGGFLPNVGGTAAWRPLALAFENATVSVPTSVIATQVQVGATKVLILMRQLHRNDASPNGLSTIPQNQTSHDVGVSEGRHYAEDELGLQETDFVNPWERLSGTGKGIDDVMIDANGDLWICEWKGGDYSELSSGQMGKTWVLQKIAELRADPRSQVWGQKLSDAFDAGRLRGVAVKTPCKNGTVGETFELGRWHYLP
jgi:hypothetical protein